MRKFEIEAWALRAVDAVAAQRQPEDSHLECKAEWIEPIKAARQIAGLCNAARGAPALWVVGLDEVKGVVSVRDGEFSEWWAKVSAQFDGPIPTLEHIVLSTVEGTLTLLYFETDMAPFLVRNPSFGIQGGGSIEREIPWREGARTLTARREHLVRLLVPALSKPQIETLSGELTVRREAEGGPSWNLVVHTYWALPLGQTIVLPDFRTRAEIAIPELNMIKSVPATFAPGGRQRNFLNTEDNRLATAHRGVEQLIVEGPGHITAHAQWHSASTGDVGAEHLATSVSVELTALPSGSDERIRVTVELIQDPTATPSEGAVIWRTKPSPEELDAD